MLLASLSKARQGLSSKSPLESVSVLFTLKVFLETIVGAAHPPKQKWGEERGRLPWAAGFLCATPPFHTWGVMPCHTLLPLTLRSGRPGGREGMTSPSQVESGRWGFVPGVGRVKEPVSSALAPNKYFIRRVLSVNCPAQVF